MTKKPLLASLVAADEEGGPQAERPMVKPKFGASSAAVNNIGKGFALQSEGRVVDIDPSLVDPSPFVDRLELDEVAQAELVASILADGQRIPVLVRPHPGQNGRYQLAYGHRRWRAALRIRATVQGKEGLPLRAFVSQLTDLELAARQASENIDRQNLSWIDQALFLSELEAAGQDVKGAAESILKVDRTVAWRMRSVMGAIPRPVIEGIGSAKRIGMPRWVALADLFEKAPEKSANAALSIIEKLNAVPDNFGDKTEGGRGDRRFLAVFNAVNRAATRVSGASDPSRDKATVKITKTSVQVKFPADQAQFGQWFEAEFPALWEKYLAAARH